MFLLPSCTAWRSRYKFTCTWRLTGDREKKGGDSIPQQKKKSRKSSETVQLVQLQCYTGKILDSSFGTCHFWLHLATHGNGDHRSHPYVIFQFFSNLRAQEGSNIFPKKRACWGIIGTHSGAEGACSKSSAHNDLQGIWSAWFFCLCSSSKSARSCWNATPKNISANSFFRCVHLQQIHAPKYTIYFIGTLYVRMQFRNQVGEHQIRTFFPICPRRCTHLWAFAAPANPTQQGLEQKLFPKTGILTVLFVMMTSFMILRLKDCMNLSFSISSLKKLANRQVSSKSGLCPPPPSTQLSNPSKSTVFIHFPIVDPLHPSGPHSAVPPSESKWPKQPLQRRGQRSPGLQRWPTDPAIQFAN